MLLLESLRKYSLTIGILAMASLVAGTLVEGGSLLQKYLFVVGAPVLGITAYLSGQRMFVVMQIVLTISAIMAFFSVPDIAKYAVMIGSSLVGIAYLIKINYIGKDAWWPMGGAGLLCIAAGFATNAIAYPLLFNSLLALGGWLVAAYSAIGAFRFKIKVSMIFLVLNVIFSINPTMLAVSQIL